MHMHGGRWWSGVLGAVVWATGALAAPVPSVLEPWREWVLHGHEAESCPARVGNGDTQCAWPGELRIEVDAEGVRFAQRWSVDAEVSIPLPGDDEDFRPIGVTLDGAPAPVAFDEEDRPVLHVQPGTYAVAGRIEWDTRPPTLALPDEIAWVSLVLDGAAVAVPRRDESGDLVLGATDAAEGDALQLEVYRLLADGTPPWLATRIELSVTGKPREQVLGPLLPPGFVPVALDGQVPLRWESDGRLRMQLRPGFWSATVIARAPAAATAFAMPAVPEPWVPQEIWQFRAAPEFRIAQLEGVPGVDPEQADVPNWLEGVGPETAARWQWLLASNALPTFVLDGQAKATLAASLRGLPAQRPPRLVLSRELWLTFDGSEYLARDAIDGQLGSAQRLDMREPWRLEEATGSNVNLLITHGSAPGSSGFEWRDAQVSVRSGARAARSAAMPASGWSQPFDSASAALHLPPGYRLFGATGVDQADDSWVARWSLLDLFLASMVLLLAWRLRDLSIVVALFGWLLWSWHEPDAPRLMLLLTLGLVLALRYVPAGRWQRVLGWMLRGLLVLVALWGMSFAATQLKWAIFPQLEDSSAGYGYGDDFAMQGGNFRNEVALNEAAPVEQEVAEMPMPASVPVPAPKGRAMNESLDRIEVTGSRMKRVELYKYPTDAIPQAGRARPDWRWHTHALRWNGPLLPDETLRLWISPPWLTRLLRVASVLLLGYALLALARRGWKAPPPQPRATQPEPPLRAAAALFAAMLVLPAASARAQAMPDSATLEELRTRLLEAQAPCHPDCASLATASARRSGAGVQLALEAHAQERLAFPLPWPAEAPVLAGVRVDGMPAQPLRDDSGAWVALERGVHRIEIDYASEEGRWRIEFPLSPARVQVSDDGLEASGIDEGRLIGNTLELIAASEAMEGEATPGAESGESIPPFVRVRRHLTVDQQWRLDTLVERIAPARGGLTVPVRLFEGELPLENAPPVRDGVAQVSIPAGADSVQWSSRLTPSQAYTLIATDAPGYSEEWLLDAAPLLHVEAGGLPESPSQNEGTRRFLPLPGEQLALAVTRPEAVQGASLAIEQVRLDVTPGQRARDSRLQLVLRSTRAGQHWLTLPPDSELLGLSIDGAEQPRVLDAGRVALPLRTQPQTVVVSWREAVAVGFAVRSPQLQLGADAGNVRIALQLPQDRWLLAASGPGLGPALLYWPQLALLVLVAWGLARLRLTPLRFHHWLLLGLGFSTVSWLAAGIVAAWLLLLGWRARRVQAPRNFGFTLLQVGLAFATLIALLCLVAAVPTGLLGSPDMQVAGDSYAYQLNWYLDGTDGVLPAATAWSLPLWAYKVAILAWALWLANALIGWLRWGWQAYSAGGRWYWPARKAKSVEVAAAGTPQG
jgi:hypothetical protein